MTATTHDMSAGKLSKVCYRIYNTLTAQQREHLQTIYPDEITILRLHSLGIVSVQPGAHNRLTSLYHHITVPTTPDSDQE